MNELIDDIAVPRQATEQAGQPQRILARRTARELSVEELDQVSGGQMRVGGCTVTSCCCDYDASDM